MAKSDSSSNSDARIKQYPLEKYVQPILIGVVFVGRSTKIKNEPFFYSRSISLTTLILVANSASIEISFKLRSLLLPKISNLIAWEQ